MFDLDTFIADSRAALKDASPHAAIREVVGRAVSQPQDVLRALGTPARAEIVALHRSPELTVLKIVWAPRMKLYPHDHRMWAVIGVYGGAEENTFFRKTPDGLQRVNDRLLHAQDAMPLGREAIHAVYNPAGTFTAAIHAYGGDFFAQPRSEWDPVTGQERPYDVARVRRVFEDANARLTELQASDGPGSQPESKDHS